MAVNNVFENPKVWNESPVKMQARRPVLQGFVAAIFGLSAPARAESTASVSNEVTATLRAFITAFENLEWDTFRAAFADDACVFHPSSKTPERVCGRQAVEASWRVVFDATRQEARGGPPYQRLPLESIQVQVLDSAVAVVSFELKNEKRWGRRTVVFNKQKGVWKIVHLHASNFSLD